MVEQHEMVQLLLKSAAMWASALNVPWFLAGAGLGVPAAVGTVSTGNSKLLGLVSHALVYAIRVLCLVRHLSHAIVGRCCCKFSARSWGCTLLVHHLDL